VTNQVGEAVALQKKIRDLELELARMKATHPPEEVSRLQNLLSEPLLTTRTLASHHDASQYDSR
jgi:hypothetical protein